MGTSDAQIRRSLLPGVAATVAAQRWKRLAMETPPGALLGTAFEAMKKIGKMGGFSQYPNRD